jgi:hypothetical protein
MIDKELKFEKIEASLTLGATVESLPANTLFRAFQSRIQKLELEIVLSTGP